MLPMRQHTLSPSGVESFISMNFVDQTIKHFIKKKKKVSGFFYMFALAVSLFTYILIPSRICSEITRVNKLRALMVGVKTL